MTNKIINMKPKTLPTGIRPDDPTTLTPMALAKFLDHVRAGYVVEDGLYKPWDDDSKSLTSLEVAKEYLKRHE